MRRKPKIIGVVGGVGPHAGLDLVRKIFDHTRAASDQEHLPVSLLSFPDRIGDRTEFLLGKGSANPARAILKIIDALAATGAEVVGIPCNTAHAPEIFGEVARALRRGSPKLLHMIEETAAEARRLRLRRVGVLATLGTHRSGVYVRALVAAGLEPIVPDARRQKRLHAAIYDRGYGIKARSNPVTPRARAAALGAVRDLAAAGAQAVLLGCTELPLAVPEKRFGKLPLIDPTAVLARALIREAAPDRLKKI